MNHLILAILAIGVWILSLVYFIPLFEWNLKREMRACERRSRKVKR